MRIVVIIVLVVGVTVEVRRGRVVAVYVHWIDHLIDVVVVVQVGVLHIFGCC